MTVHTEIGDGRIAGMLHLKLRNDAQAKLNLFIPDLPGEWTSAFIDSNDAERLKFIPSAEALWLVVDGRSLTSSTTRNNTIHRLTILIDRVAGLCAERRPRLLLVITHADLGRPDEQHLQRVRDKAASHRMDICSYHVASFSENPSIPPGFGISELLVATVEASSSLQAFWPDQEVPQMGCRRILRYMGAGA
jgi:hypothetical protein